MAPATTTVFANEYYNTYNHAKLNAETFVGKNYQVFLWRHQNIISSNVQRGEEKNEVQEERGKKEGKRKKKTAEGKESDTSTRVRSSWKSLEKYHCGKHFCVIVCIVQFVLIIYFNNNKITKRYHKLKIGVCLISGFLAFAFIQLFIQYILFYSTSYLLDYLI